MLYQKLNQANKDQYIDLKRKLDAIIEDEVKGVTLRSLFEDYEKISFEVKNLFCFYDIYKQRSHLKEFKTHYKFSRYLKFIQTLKCFNLLNHFKFLLSLSLLNTNI